MSNGKNVGVEISHMYKPSFSMLYTENAHTYKFIANGANTVIPLAAFLHNA